MQSHIGDVPFFFNGGLFEEADLNRCAVHTVPDAAGVSLLGIGNAPGLFHRYDFTVIDFAAVMLNGGLDAVVANSPDGRQEEIGTP